MPHPPLMVGRIEVAEGDRNLRGNAGEQRRSRCSCLSVEGGQAEATSHRLKPLEADRSLLAADLADRSTEKLSYRADSRMNGHTHGWPGRPRCGEQATHIVPDTSRRTVLGMESLRKALRACSPPFPKAPVLLQNTSKGSEEA